jgi:hypothetical protein
MLPHETAVPKSVFASAGRVIRLVRLDPDNVTAHLPDIDDTKLMLG